MSAAILLPSCVLGLCAALLLAERLVVGWARGRFKVVVHVNGTRGKSTLTRMTHAMLRAAGYTVYGKTTGTEPRLLSPDGAERVIRRLGPANVREQRNYAVLAALRGADALVFECNAVLPELQKVSALYLGADLLVITNARADHRLEQGTAREAALAFAATIPPGGAVATADPEFSDLWAAEAEARRAGFFYRAPAEGVGLSDIPENAACLLASADALGLPPAAALEALRSYTADPGEFRLVRWLDERGGSFWFADALAANDPASTSRLVDMALKRADLEGVAWGRRVLVVVNRPDRPDRCLQFAEYAAAECGPGRRFDTALFLGPLPRYARAALDSASAPYARLPDPESLFGALPPAGGVDGSPGPEACLIVGVGNRVGLGTRLRACVDSREPLTVLPETRAITGAHNES
ncbi:MAG: hypothetical protein KKA67_14135 [Spirochaetes bacterium]|nr:hypothetical protein [Spirochaetota bacterium]MBU1080522.1 hypothetical protein [Spirochaetota bacterium]